MIKSTVGPYSISLKEIPVPPNNIMMIVDTEYGHRTSSHEYFFDESDFLKFFKPVVEYYEQLKNKTGI